MSSPHFNSFIRPGTYRLKIIRLWNELSMAILNFLFHVQIKGKVEFDFYTDFVKKFQKNIDQIKLLKIIKEVITNLTSTLIFKIRLTKN